MHLQNYWQVGRINFHFCTHLPWPKLSNPTAGCGQALQLTWIQKALKCWEILVLKFFVLPFSELLRKERNSKGIFLCLLNKKLFGDEVVVVLDNSSLESSSSHQYGFDSYFFANIGFALFIVFIFNPRSVCEDWFLLHLKSSTQVQCGSKRTGSWLVWSTSQPSFPPNPSPRWKIISKMLFLQFVKNSSIAGHCWRGSKSPRLGQWFVFPPRRAQQESVEIMVFVFVLQENQLKE